MCDAILKLRNLARSSDNDLRKLPELRDSLKGGTIFHLDDGKVRFAGADLFTRSTEGVLADRIRPCEICQKVFWAARIDKVTCSPRCSGVQRQRNIRKKR